ncbi:MAG TPA: alpha/beta fold hydrolase, partial [Solirubrobacteraceae bacterium]|nr:alpha/beta fold hydrolase [Solirubrobacteraceae bacterium]
MSETVVMLHGFAGTSRHWDAVAAELDRERYSPLALELADADPLALDGAIDLVATAGPETFVLCGYSMGGRIALHVALALRRRVTRLVVVSASGGIDDGEARAERLAADERLAAEIERDGVERFVERWRETPLFATDPPAIQDAVARDTRRLSPALIAATLRAYSPGILPGLGGRLGAIDVPAVVVAGARDRPYCAIGRRLARELADARYVEVPGSGHRVTLEAPAAVAAAIDAGHAPGPPLKRTAP